MVKRFASIAVGGIVIAIAAALCIALYLKSDAYCRTDQNCKQLLRVEQLIDLYWLDTGTRPAELSVLLRANSHGWEPPRWLNTTHLADQWGHPILYVRDPSSSSFRLVIRAAESQPDHIGPSADIIRESR